VKRSIFVILFAAASIFSARVAAQDVGAPEPAEAAPPNTAAPNAVATEAETEAVPMSAEELAALGLDADAPAVNLGLEVSGFADAGFSMLLGPKDSYWRASNFAPAHSTFFVGNFNLILHKNLSTWLSTTGEVRFTFLPNGANEYGLGERSDTTTADYTDFGRLTRWGSIIIERIYIDWSPHPLLTVRVGQFLSPYGVWNVDHGSPVYIPIRRPWTIGEGWIPERQTGIELFGRTELGSSLAFGYHLTVSNGKGPVSEYADLDENKAIGGRLFLELRGAGKLRLGFSGYYGRETDASYGRGLKADGTTVVSVETLKASFDTLTVATDLTWQIGGLHLQTEWLLNQNAFTDEGRVPIEILGAAGASYPSDNVSWGGYGLIGYRFTWLGIMPFVLAEVADGSFHYYKLKLWSVQTGLNIRPDDAAVLKLAFEHTHVDMEGLSPVNTIWAQIAWSF
jgi:hypothetical protein